DLDHKSQGDIIIDDSDGGRAFRELEELTRHLRAAFFIGGVAEEPFFPKRNPVLFQGATEAAQTVLLRVIGRGCAVISRRADIAYLRHSQADTTVPLLQKV